MQGLDWNDLRYVLAVGRGCRISAAARALGVDSTTVSRRLKSLENLVQSELFIRSPDGRLQPTQIASEIISHAERMENEAAAIAEALGRSAHQLTGTVRLTAVPVLVNRVLVRCLKPFLSENAGLGVELIPEARDLNLTRREADLAIRLARPRIGGNRVKARRIGVLDYGVFVAADCADDQVGTLDWIAYEEAMSHLPQARWLASFKPPDRAQPCGLRVADAETAIEAVANGIGRALLPARVADDDPRLRRIAVGGLPTPPVREVWLLSHADRRDLKSVRKVVEWIDGIRWSGTC